ncbi:MAG: helix-turn-helix domain-containing protein [Erysipelotrichaceae bacterium]|nr:helix-turn-helix domain-containing protein [Erysipelotrichaceae bacterium]
MKNKLDIKKERLAIGYTQAKLAQKLGVTEKSVSKWESGRGEPSFENLQKMCIIFNKNINNECCELRKKKRMFFALRVVIALLSLAYGITELVKVIGLFNGVEQSLLVGDMYYYYAINRNSCDYAMAGMTLSIISLLFSIASCFEFKNKKLYFVFYLITSLCSVVCLVSSGIDLFIKCVLAVQIWFILFLFYLYIIENRKKVN